MIFAEQTLFNLFVNSTCSFLAGGLIVFLAFKLFRVQTTRWKLYFLTLPFVKILWDIFRGIPATSYLHTHINPLHVPPKHTMLNVGAGFSEYGPIFEVTYGVKDATGHEYSISLADYLREWLGSRFSPDTPRILLTILLAVSATLLLRRLWQAIQFELTRKIDRASAASIALESSKLLWRTVDIYTSEQFNGTPFTGGIIRPYICIPDKTFQALSPDERHAVLRHELAHIKHGDLFINLAIQLLGDLFWFVPGYRFLSRKIDRMREILADRSAVALGASADHLASALLKLKTDAVDSPMPVLYSALVREKSLLKIRVNNLLGRPIDSQNPRLGWNNRWARLLIEAWTTGGVMICTLGGNHEVTKIPEWVERLVKAWGWM